MEIYGYTALVTDVLNKTGQMLGKFVADVQNGNAKDDDDIKDLF